MSTSPLHAQLAASSEAYIRKLQSHLDSQIAQSASRIAIADQLSSALTSRGIEAAPHAELDDEPSIYIWVKAQGTTVPDIEEALARADIRVTGVHPGLRETEICTQLHADVCIYIAYADIPAPAL